MYFGQDQCKWIKDFTGVKMLLDYIILGYSYNVLFQLGKVPHLIKIYN